LHLFESSGFETSGTQNSWLPEAELRGFLANYTKYYPNNILNYTFISAPLSSIEIFQSQKRQLSSVALYPIKTINIFGVEENLLRTVFSEYYLPTLYDDSIEYPKINGKKDAIAGLFSNNSLPNVPSDFDTSNITSGYNSL